MKAGVFVFVYVEHRQGSSALGHELWSGHRDIIPASTLLGEPTESRRPAASPAHPCPTYTNTNTNTNTPPSCPGRCRVEADGQPATVVAAVGLSAEIAVTRAISRQRLGLVTRAISHQPSAFSPLHRSKAGLRGLMRSGVRVVQAGAVSCQLSARCTGRRLDFGGESLPRSSRGLSRPW